MFTFHCFDHLVDACSDEDTDVKSIVKSWLQRLPPSTSSPLLEEWIDDHFYHAMKWVLKHGDFVTDTTLVGVAMNGLTHLVGVSNKAEFTCALIRGLGGNLTTASRTVFAKEVSHRMMAWSAVS